MSQVEVLPPGQLLPFHFELLISKQVNITCTSQPGLSGLFGYIDVAKREREREKEKERERERLLGVFEDRVVPADGVGDAASLCFVVHGFYTRICIMEGFHTFFMFVLTHPITCIITYIRYYIISKQNKTIQKKKYI